MAAAAAAPAAVGGLEGNKEWMDEEDLKLVDALVAEGQAHLLADWPAPGESDDGKRRLLAQLRAGSIRTH
jgi:hypothetical protein